MSYLPDVNVLLATIWADHPNHGNAFNWLEGKQVILCPICELGFLRISSDARAFNFPMAQAREGLARFIRDRNAERIADDLPPLESRPRTSDEVTDHDLADLAVKHGIKLATLDGRLKHPCAELIR